MVSNMFTDVPLLSEVFLYGFPHFIPKQADL